MLNFLAMLEESISISINSSSTISANLMSYSYLKGILRHTIWLFLYTRGVAHQCQCRLSTLSIIQHCWTIQHAILRSLANEFARKRILFTSLDCNCSTFNSIWPYPWPNLKLSLIFGDFATLCLVTFSILKMVVLFLYNLWIFMNDIRFFLASWKNFSFLFICCWNHMMY